MAETKGGYFQVFERQQRAAPLLIDIFDPKTADRLHQKAFDIQVNGTRKIESFLKEVYPERISMVLRMILSLLIFVGILLPTIWCRWIL